MTSLVDEEILLRCGDGRDDGPAVTAALCPDGGTILISDHRAKSLKGLVCMACGTQLIAVKGAERAWHFRHRSDRDCRHGGETALHLLAKAVLEQRPEILLPAIMVQTRDMSEEIKPAQWVKLAGVRLERREDGFVPDVQAEIDETPLFIEVRVTHAVDIEKGHRIAARGVSTVEIDLSGLPRRSSLDLISEAIRHKAPRSWVFSRLGALRTAQQREQEDRQDAQKAEKLRREIEDVASRVVKAPGVRRATRTEEANLRRARRLGFEPLLTAAIGGDGAFTVSAEVWRATLIELLILQPCREVSGSGAFTDDQTDGTWMPHHWKTPSWSGYPPGPVTLSEAVALASRHRLLVQPGARLRREVADGIRQTIPTFRSGSEAIYEFLRCAVELGMMKELRGWGAGIKFGASSAALKKVWREHRCLDALASIETAAREELGRDIKAAWIDNHRPSEIEAVEFDELLGDLKRIAAAFVEPYPRPGDLRGLPLGEALARADRQRKAFLDAQRAGRTDALTAAARNTLQDGADEWLHSPLPMLAGKPPFDLASESDDGLRRATHALATTADARLRLKATVARAAAALGEEALDVWLTTPRSADGSETVHGFVARNPDKIAAVEREIDTLIEQQVHAQRQEAKRQAVVGSRMEELEKLAVRLLAHDPVSTSLLLRNAHPMLGGRRPMEACETQQGFEAAKAMIRQAAELSRKRRG